MAILLPDARSLTDDVLQALRLRALRGCALGFCHADIADLLGLARETVSRWWEAYQVGGLDRLPGDRTGRPPGSGRILTDEQAQHLQQLMDNHSCPEQLGIASPLWNRRAVRELIRQTYGLCLSVRTVGAYLKRWGYTAKKPRRHQRDQDPVAVAQWLTRTYPEVAQQAAREGAELLWCDEVGVAADAFPGYGYARQGQPSTVEVPKPHIRCNVIAAISNTGRLRFMTYQKAMTATLFLDFLRRLRRGLQGQKIYLVLDHLPAHEAEVVQQWLARHRDQIEAVPLPKYAPELNAEEYLNNDLKGNVKAHGLPHGQPELRSLIQQFLYRLLHWPSKVRNYFRHPSVQYAAAPGSMTM